MKKTDLSKIYPSHYKAKTKPEEIFLEKAHYLNIEGKGDPSAQEFSGRIQALYSVAYAIKFLCKERGDDFVVPKLEGQWWYDENKYKGVTMDKAATDIPRSEWRYCLMIKMPSFVTQNDFDHGLQKAGAKRQNDFAKELHFLAIELGRCVQILHVGPFHTEGKSLALLKDYMDINGLVRNGKHYEVYLSDFNKVAEEKLKTILREPVK
jgi:hypothetical protein